MPYQKRLPLGAPCYRVYPSKPCIRRILRFSTKGPISHRNAAAIAASPDIIYTRAHHEPLLCEAEYREVQTRMQKNCIPSRTKAPSVGLHKHYLSGLLYCGRCGTGMTYANRSSSPCFRCRAYARGQCTDSSYLSLSVAVQCLLTSLDDFGTDLSLVTSRSSQTDTDLEMPVVQAASARGGPSSACSRCVIWRELTPRKNIWRTKPKAKHTGSICRRHCLGCLLRFLLLSVCQSFLGSSDWSMEEKHDALHAW